MTPPLAFVLTRDVTQAECPWLRAPLAAGTVVYEFKGRTFGCVAPWAFAATAAPGVLPFFELPSDAVADLLAGVGSGR